MSKSTNPKIELDFPMNRGETRISSVELRRPSAGELRGIQLVELMQMDTDSLIKLLPRITKPALTEQEIKALDPADLISLGAEAVGFLVSKRLKDPEATMTA